MKSKSDPPPTLHISSRAAIWVMSVAAGVSIFLLAIFLRLVYDDWMHHNASLHILGSLVVGTIVSIWMARRQLAIRQRKIEMLRRFETIRWMNDRIRNALQAIECVTYAAAPDATEAVRSSVESIESVLHEVLTESHPTLPREPAKTRRTAQIS